MAPSTHPSILFIHVSRIGDTLFVTPSLRAVATALPDARITVLGHPKRVEVLRHLPWVQQVAGISKQRAPWMGHLSGRHYEWALVYGFDLPLVAYALRVAQRVIAFRQSDDSLNARLFRTVEPPPFQSAHSVNQLLQLPAAMGIPPSGSRLAMQLTQTERETARNRLARQASALPLVGLQVASFPTKSYRDWPMDHFLQLCQAMIARWPTIHFLIFGGKEEQKRTEWLRAQLGERATSYAGRLTLRETAAVMSQIDLYVGVDTGPTHIMSTFDVPLVALYHCLSASAHTGPLDHPCCQLIDHPRTGQGCSPEASMGEISVESVLAAVTRLLEGYPPRR